jgi:hypothetical protein
VIRFVRKNPEKKIVKIRIVLTLLCKISNKFLDKRFFTEVKINQPKKQAEQHKTNERE